MTLKPGMRFLIRVLCVIAVSLAVNPAAAADAQLDKPTLDWFQKILDLWETNCRDKLRLPPEPLPWIIFYDELHAWHVHPEQQLLPSHTRTEQTLRFAGKEYPLFEVNNEGKLWVPGRDPLSTDARGVAMLYAGESKAFFVLATPSLLSKSTGAEATPEFLNFFTTTAQHELTHTRHLAEAMPIFEELRSKYRIPESLDDNVIQTTFSASEEYRSMYEQERGHLSRAVVAEDPEAAKQEIDAALAAAAARRQRFFVGDYEGWSAMEDIFLALEGAAMWVQFQTARELAPPGESWVDTLITLATRTDAWSQEEGLALFLLIDRFQPEWPALFFTSSAPPAPFAVLTDALGQSP